MTAILVAAAITLSALVGGFLWGWAVSAVPGLRRVPDRTYVTTMQSVNRAILNPVFLVAFVGALVVLGLAALVAFARGESRRGWWMAAATVTYAVGVVGITAAGNVPLNNRLEAFDLDSGTEETVSSARRAYEGPWNRLHYVRSAIGVLVVVLASVAALTPAED